MKQIIINVNELDVRVAIVEDGKLTEFFMEKESTKRIMGNIYMGKVANVLPGMESAFVNIGLEKNAFLYVKDLREFEEKYLDGIENSNKPIEDILNVGDNVIVQILKEPRGTKGARVTTHYTIPGKYLVLMPNNDYIAVSKKIEDIEERERLVSILADIKPSGAGVIIRTAAKHKEDPSFEKEILYLMKQWQEIEGKISKAKVGDTVYKDYSLIKRICRDVFSNDVDELIIDSEEKHWELVEYVSAFSDKTMKTKVRLYERTDDIFDYYDVNKELENALDKKVWLSCGGYLIIEKTEALISIDVNTGKNVGSYNLEGTVFQTNCEAAIEIPRQLKLRNLSGIIIIDFIDMTVEEDKEKLIEVLEENLKKDRIRNNIVRFTELGLVEMTRKRIGKELSTYFKESCKVCLGTGKVDLAETIVHKIMQEIKRVIKDEDVSKVILKCSEEIYNMIDEIYMEFIEEYVANRKKTFEFIQEKAYNRKEYNIYLEK